MADLIDREQAIKVALTYLVEYCGAAFDEDMQKGLEAKLNRLPTVDAVPVVRCRDCKHHHFDKDGIPYCDGIDYGYGWKDDEFCSRWERK